MFFQTLKIEEVVSQPVKACTDDRHLQRFSPSAATMLCMGINLCLLMIHPECPACMYTVEC